MTNIMEVTSRWKGKVNTRNIKISKFRKELKQRGFLSEKKNIVEKLYSETSENEIASLFSQYGETVSQTIDESGLSFMLKFAKENKNKWDSFTNVRIVESILNSLSRFNKNNKQAAINESLELLRNVEKTAFRVSDSYKVNGVFPDYVAESRIAERVNRNIKYWENELKSL